MANACYCSFCGKSNCETEVMIAGPVHVFICEECVFTCVTTISAKKRDDAEKEKLFADARRCAFCTPESLHGR